MCAFCTFLVGYVVADARVVKNNHSPKVVAMTSVGHYMWVYTNDQNLHISYSNCQNEDHHLCCTDQFITGGTVHYSCYMFQNGTW